MSYYKLHREKIIGGNKGRMRSQPRDLQPGKVYEIRYDSRTASKQRYIILTLNLWPVAGGMKNQKVHCLDLDLVPPIEFRKVIKESSGIVDAAVGKFKHQMIGLPSGTGKPLNFYKKNLVRLERTLPGIYKTFRLDKMKMVELLDYDFRSMLTPRLQKHLEAKKTPTGENTEDIYQQEDGRWKNEQGKFVKGPDET
tara:strand:+ start:77 stop:664 length:588 start_codon:yes stop_codon:yes gene_type:complete